MQMTVPTNARLGEILRAIRHDYLNGQRAKDVVVRLREQVPVKRGPEGRGPARSLSTSSFLRRETGDTDLELSTFLMVLAEAGIKLMLVDDDGRPLPPKYQLSTLPDRPPTSVDFLSMAADLQRQVDRLVSMANVSVEKAERDGTET